LAHFKTGWCGQSLAIEGQGRKEGESLLTPAHRFAGAAGVAEKGFVFCLKRGKDFFQAKLRAFGQSLRERAKAKERMCTGNQTNWGNQTRWTIAAGGRPWEVELLESSHTDFLIVNNDKAIPPVEGGQIGYETLHSFLGLFSRGWPYAKSNNTMVMSKRVESGVGEILIEGQNDRSIFLCPKVKELIRPSLKSEFVDMPDFPTRQLTLQPA
jgi:hypothetical protein